MFDSVCILSYLACYPILLLLLMLSRDSSVSELTGSGIQQKYLSLLLRLFRRRKIGENVKLSFEFMFSVRLYGVELGIGATLGPYLLTYLLTAWCGVLLEKRTGLQLVKKFPAFHGTRKFITALTRVRHLSLSWASPIQSIYPHPTSWRSILILSTHLRLGLASGLLPSGFPSKTSYTPLSSPIRATCTAHGVYSQIYPNYSTGEELLIIYCTGIRADEWQRY